MVPHGVAAGWELEIDNRIVLVRTVNADVIVVENPDGTTEEINVVQEDNDENTVELEGTQLPDDDTTTPAVETEEEVEIEVEEGEEGGE